jgi:hypothetical protein
MRRAVTLRHRTSIFLLGCASIALCLCSSSRAAYVTFEDVERAVADDRGYGLSNPITIDGIVFRTDSSNSLCNLGKDFNEGGLFTSDYFSAGVDAGTTNFTMTFPEPITHLTFETTIPGPVGLPGRPQFAHYRLTSHGNAPVSFTSSTDSLDLIDLDFANPTSQVAISFVSGYTVVLNMDNLQTSSVPEPGSLALIGVAAVGAIAYGWRRRKQ